MERLDDLIINDMKIWQRKDEFCFSIDALLLAHFAKIKTNKKYADLGCGTGVMPLLLAAFGAKDIVGFEINDIVADLARRSVEYNDLKSFIKIVETDYRLAYKEYGGQFDYILVNPPYFEQGCGKLSNSSNIASALHESETTINEVIQACKRLLKFGATMYMIYTAPRLVDAFLAMREHNIEPKRVRFVHSKPGTEAKLVLIEAKYGAKPSLKVEKPLYIYKEENIYSDEINSWYER